MSKKSLLILSAILVLVGFAFVGCKTLDGDVAPEQDPSVILFPNADSIVVSAAPLLYWRGLDRDGEVYKYEYIDIVKSQLNDDTNYYSYYNDPSTMPDTIVGELKTFSWLETEKSRDTIFFSLLDGETETEHLFCVRGIDSQDRKSDPQCYIWFRRNQPPDSLSITSTMFIDDDYDTLWCLKELTASWTGINISWMATDPDNSIILEYYWYLEDIHTLDTLRTSVSVDSSEIEYDSTGAITAVGPYSGNDPKDGWLRDNIHVTLYDIPTGDYRFIVKVRDDAFMESIADTAEMTLVKPLFDISDPDINEEMVNGTFAHKVLVVDETYDATYLGVPEGNDYSHGFYSEIFEEVKNRGTITDFDTVELALGLTPPIWSLTKHELAEFSIMYWYDADDLNMNKANADIFNAMQDYISVGGSVVIEGRRCFIDQYPGSSADDVIAETHFGLVEHSNGTFSYASGSVVHELDGAVYTFEDMHINEELMESFGADPTSITNVLGCTTQEYNPFGLPAATPIYFFEDTENPDSDASNRPSALLYKTRNYRTAFFSYPLMLMDNSEGVVTDAIDNTMNFLTKRFPIVEEIDTTQG